MSAKKESRKERVCVVWLLYGRRFVVKLHSDIAGNSEVVARDCADCARFREFERLRRIKSRVVMGN